MKCKMNSLCSMATLTWCSMTTSCEQINGVSCFNRFLDELPNMSNCVWKLHGNLPLSRYAYKHTHTQVGLEQGLNKNNTSWTSWTWKNIISLPKRLLKVSSLFQGRIWYVSCRRTLLCVGVCVCVCHVFCCHDTATAWHQLSRPISDVGSEHLTHLLGTNSDDTSF